MKVKYDPEADILMFPLKDIPPSHAISGPGGMIASYDDSDEPISIEFLNASKHQWLNFQELQLAIAS